jgi:predicted DNA-binding WGR domain protein
MAEITYICNTDQSNKFWSYETEGSKVTFRWGRIGGTSDSQTKTFRSPMEAQKEIAKKLREKEKKGYNLVTKAKLSEETKVAEALGPQNKIKRMLWVSKKDTELTQLNNYDPGQYVYVEILNSWSKDITRLLLSKEDTWELSKGITEAGDKLLINGLTKLKHGHTFASAVRDLLKKMAVTVAEVLKSVKFAAIGNRSLFDDEVITAEESSVKMALADIDIAGFDSSVVSKFASMGMRSLDL